MAASDPVHAQFVCGSTDSDGYVCYEEYHPYGSTAWHAADSSLAPGLKRYRYTGKEKDDETGLYYHGARFYACWLGRWCSSDPIGMGDGVNRYAYVRGNPLGATDPTGLGTEDQVVDEGNVVGPDGQSGFHFSSSGSGPEPTAEHLGSMESPPGVASTQIQRPGQLNSFAPTDWDANKQLRTIATTRDAMGLSAGWLYDAADNAWIIPFGGRTLSIGVMPEFRTTTGTIQSSRNSYEHEAAHWRLISRSSSDPVMTQILRDTQSHFDNIREQNPTAGYSSNEGADEGIAQYVGERAQAENDAIDFVASLNDSFKAGDIDYQAVLVGIDWMEEEFTRKATSDFIYTHNDNSGTTPPLPEFAQNWANTEFFDGTAWAANARSIPVVDAIIREMEARWQASQR